MLDMGFIPDVRKIIHSTPLKANRQTLFFSATLSSVVKRLAVQWTKDAVNVEIEHEQTAGDKIEQLVYIVTNKEKFPLLYNLITGQQLSRVIIFTNRKDETRLVEELLLKYGINCKVLSGDIDQRQRLRTLDDFKAGKIKVLVATDVAGRGIHIEGVSHVINYTLPEDPEDYVHRIGRTGRAGASGISISFASEDDSFQIPAIEKFLGNKLICTFPPEELLVPLPKVKSRVAETKEK
jgi:ATP-dependent RNA helicase RhlB